jgi:polysaccharide transporter, PST family
MTLIRTSLLNAIAVGIRLISMLVLNKILALEIGPNGYGLVGQLQNAITSITAIASAGVGTGVTKYTAEYSNHRQKQRDIWVTASFLGFIFSLLVATILIIFRNELSLKLFKTDEYADILIWVAACLVLYVFNTLLLSIINGLKEISLFVAANIANSLVALIVTGILARLYELEGALIALAINQSIACIATIFLIRKKIWFRYDNFVGRPSSATILRLSQYSLMAVATSVLGPLSMIVVRDMLISNAGLSAAGYWEAMTRISSLYLMLITTPLSVYYLPKLSELTDTVDLRSELTRGLTLLVPLTISIALVIYLLRDVIIALLFSDAFMPMKDLFLWQLIGDVVRVTAWLLSFFLISKALTKEFLIVEIFTTLTFILLSYEFIKKFDVLGITIAYAVNNFVYLFLLMLVVTLFFRKLQH